MKLLDDYRAPAMGTIDPIGFSPMTAFCLFPFPGGCVCTLPMGHACDFHVAHGGDGRVLNVLSRPVPTHLRLPEGF